MIDFITELFCRIDDRMRRLAEHPQAVLWPSEIVILGVVRALEGAGDRDWLITRYHNPAYNRPAPKQR